MRPKDLKFPFTWGERKPTLFKGVLIVPQFYQGHEALPNLYPEKKSICVEYCSGNGDWVIEKAKKNPTKFWIAVEMRFERVRKIWSKMQNQGIQNLLIVCGEAITFSKYYLPENFVDEIYVNFPDPWPKERHAKYRLIQEPFVEELARAVKKGGKAIYVTDDSTYSCQMIDVMLSSPEWKNLFPAPYYVQNWEDYGRSWFQHLWERKGRNFFYMQFGRL